MLEAKVPSAKCQDLFSPAIVQRPLGELGGAKGWSKLDGNWPLIHVLVVQRGRLSCRSGEKKTPLNDCISSWLYLLVCTRSCLCMCVSVCACARSLDKQASQIPSSWTVQWKVSLKMQYIIFHEFNRVFMILQSASTRHSPLEAAQQET